MTHEICREDPYLKECEATVERAGPEGIVLDRTVFYPMGGGQPGDTGKLVREDGTEVRITDTRKDRETGELRHIPEEGASLPAPGEKVTAVIDWDRRYRLMRMHSCMHLLCAVIPAPVTGGQVWEDRARLDFDLPDPLDKAEVEEKLTQLIEEDHPRTFRWITDEELEANPELVRTMSVKPPTGAGKVRLVNFEGVDLQPCGGTHVASTGEVGAVQIAKIEKKGKKNRRVVVSFAE